MFQFKRDFNEIYCGARKAEIARGLNPRLQTFDEWLARNKNRIPHSSAAPLKRCVTATSRSLTCFRG
jgi:hypothetical protein